MAAGAFDEVASIGSRERVRHVTGLDPAEVFDHEKIAAAMRLMFEAIGEDPEREGLAKTPDRVARAFDEVFAGLLVDPGDVISVVFEEGHDEMVMVRDMDVVSMCEHHWLPMFGRAHVAYIPNEKGQITGLSKIARLVDVVAKRPNLQERITKTIADTLVERLDPRGVLVVVELRHLCMEMRGVRKMGAETVTSAVRGIFLEDPRTRAEAMALIARPRSR